MVYYQTNYVTVSWEDELQAVYSIWAGYTGGNEGKVQTGYTKISELAAHKQSRKWLSDIRNLKVLDPPDQEWVVTAGHNMLVKAGIRYIAAVMPENIIAKMSLNRVINKVGGVDIEIISFADLEEAGNWLRSK